MKYIFFNLISFCFFMAVSYVVYPHLASRPERGGMEGTGTIDFTGQKYDPDLYGPDAVARLEEEITGLREIIAELRENEVRSNAVIDSLQRVASMAQRQATAKQEIRMAHKESTAIANSLLELDEDALSDILTLLDDRQLMVIYNAAGKLQQGKLLRSLDPERAAQLLKKVIS